MEQYLIGSQTLVPLECFSWADYDLRARASSDIPKEGGFFSSGFNSGRIDLNAALEHFRVEPPAEDPGPVVDPQVVQDESRRLQLLLQVVAVVAPEVAKVDVERTVKCRRGTSPFLDGRREQIQGKIVPESKLGFSAPP